MFRCYFLEILLGIVQLTQLLVDQIFILLRFANLDVEFLLKVAYFAFLLINLQLQQPHLFTLQFAFRTRAAALARCLARTAGITAA